MGRLARLKAAIVLGALAPGCVFALTVTVNDLRIDLPVLALPVLPGQVLDLAALGSDHAPVTATLDGEPIRLESGRGELAAPRVTGVHALRFESAGETIQANLLVMVPADRVVNGRLNGYRIDPYPARPLRGLRVYEPPRGFVEVTRDNESTPVSPSYRLGEFLAKQGGDDPRYLVLRPRLLIKLEMIGTALRAHGLDFEKFTIMSGYRTPYYNRAIGNVQYSRHVWGGAADIYIDRAPRDGNMDDLDGNGRVDKADARWLWDFIDRMKREGRFGDLVGGLGLYDANAARGPFVHVDVRGFEARW